MGDSDALECLLDGGCRFLHLFWPDLPIYPWYAGDTLDAALSPGRSDGWLASVAADPETDALFDEAIAKVTEAYRVLVEAGIPAEDARYLLPNAAETKIVITMNVRELLHFFELRCCNRAQWEIRNLAWKMLELARPTAPYIFADAGAPCVHGICPEGKMTCGNPFPRVDRATLDQ